jgi:hypothetical protein
LNSLARVQVIGPEGGTEDSVVGAGVGEGAAGVDDADMATMLMSMRGAWIGEDGVQQGFPSQEGGPRLIRFESPRWMTKGIQVRAQFGVQEQCAIKRTLRSHTELVLDLLYMVGSKIS